MKAILLCLSAVLLGAAAQAGLLGKLVGKALENTGDVLTPDDFSSIRFILYTNSSNSSYAIADVSELPANPLFDPSKPTALYAYGWTETNQSDSVAVVSGAFRQRDTHNFVLIDWGDYVAGDYITSTLRVPGAGEAVGSAINALVAAGVARDTLWIIGHSLGGQLAGALSKHLDFKPTRITGLDPAGPLYTGAPLNPGLSSDDAVLVDVIHTDADVAGFAGNDGTIDFWPNNGRRPQPGCNVGETDVINALTGCSHYMSWRYLAASVNDEAAFPAVSCRSWLAFRAGLCAPGEDNDNVAYMGIAAAASNLTGTFYLRTAAEEPYGLGLDGAVPASEVPETTTPEATTPEATTPEATTPEATTPEATTPEATTPEATTPEDTTTEAESTTPESATLSEELASSKALKLFIQLFS